MSQFLLDEILTGDMRTLRNVEVAACEIQTGDMDTPLTGLQGFFASWMIGVHTIRKNGAATVCPIELG